MIKILISVITFSFFTQALNAQTEPKIFVSISGGLSLPLRDFGATDFKKPESGFAGVGTVADFTFGYHLNQKYGLLAMVRGQANFFNSEGLKTSLENGNPNVNWGVVDDGFFTVGGVLLGGFRNLSISKSQKTNLQIRASLGIMQFGMPEYRYVGRTESIIAASGKRWAATTTAFSYLLGVGVTHKIIDNVNLIANVDYLGANPEYRDVESLAVVGIQTSSGKSTFRQKFGALNISIGLGFSL